MGDSHRIVHGRMYQDGPFYPRQYVPPGSEPSIDARSLSDQEVTALREAFLRKAHGQPKLLTPLPRRVRARLAYRRAVDEAAIWLIDHGRLRAAERLWRAFGMWPR
jgi:hypothetical protein